MSQEKNLSMSREEEDDDDESKYTDNGNGGVDSNIHLSIRSMAVQTSSTRNTDTNGNSSSADSGSEMVKLDRRQLRHSVSIIVDPVIEDVDDDDLTLGEHEPRTSRGSSLILLDDFVLDTKDKREEENTMVQSLIANARLRKEEFARLLEEHRQLVHEINRVETSLL